MSFTLLEPSLRDAGGKRAPLLGSAAKSLKALCCFPITAPHPLSNGWPAAGPDAAPGEREARAAPKKKGSVAWQKLQADALIERVAGLHLLGTDPADLTPASCKAHWHTPGQLLLSGSKRQATSPLTSPAAAAWQQVAGGVATWALLLLLSMSAFKAMCAARAPSACFLALGALEHFESAPEAEAAGAHLSLAAA